MSVKIRLKKIGRKKQTTFRIVVTDTRRAVAGKVIETIGHYSPYMKEKPLVIDLERVQAWRDKGAIPSEAVLRLLRRSRRGPAPVLETKVSEPAAVADVTETPDESVADLPAEDRVLSQMKLPGKRA